MIKLDYLKPYVTENINPKMFDTIQFVKEKCQLPNNFNHGTDFFRWNFEELDKYLSSLKLNKKDLEILSMPCSTWEEVYTLSSIMEKNNLKYKIDGVDFSEECLEKWRKWIYDIPNSNIDQLKNIFNIKNGKIILKNEIDNNIKFKYWDIFSKDWLENKKYDIISFQNLIIHFQDEEKKLKMMVENIDSLLNIWGVIFTDDVEINTIIRYTWDKYEKIWTSMLKKVN